MRLAARRRDVSRIIREDPWKLTFTRKGVGGASDTSFTADGRVLPRSAMDRAGSTPFAGEVTSSSQTWLALIPWDSTDPHPRDRLTAVQESTGRSVIYTVSAVNAYAYKQEVFIDVIR